MLLASSLLYTAASRIQQFLLKSLSSHLVIAVSDNAAVAQQVHNALCLTQRKISKDQLAFKSYIWILSLKSLNF